MPTVTRTLISVQLPIDLGVFSATMRAVIDGYPGAVALESDDDDVVRLVIVEDVDDDDLRRRGAGLDFGGTFGPGE